MPVWASEGLCVFLNTGHLEVSIVWLNASFHRNSPWITSIIGVNGQMFHRWRRNWDLSNWRPNVVHPESLSSSSVTFKVCAFVYFSSRVFSGVSAVLLSPLVSDYVVEMKSLVVVFSSLRVQIRSINLWILSIAADPVRACPTSRVSSWHSEPNLTNGNTCLGICKSLTPVQVCRFWSEVTRKCQLKMSLQKRFASSLKLCHHIGCLTAWCDREEMHCIFQFRSAGSCFCCCSMLGVFMHWLWQ